MRGQIKDETVKKLLTDYKNIVDELHELGILQTSHVVGGVGEWYAVQKFGLQRAKSQQKIYDAIDPKTNLTYQIKSGKDTNWTSGNTKNSELFNVKDFSADFLICIGFDNNWDIVTCAKIPRDIAAKSIKSNTINVNRAFLMLNPQCYFLDGPS